MMHGHRFDLISKWLVTCRNSRRSTLRALAAGALSTGLGALGLHEAAAAKCKKEGKKCKKSKECCSKKCKGGKCQCSKVRAACTGTSSTQGNTCCGDLYCGTNACGEDKRCCHLTGNTCQADCDCCGEDGQCHGGECCVGEGGLCFSLSPGPSPCCAGLFCDAQSGVTCQPKP